MGIQLAPIEGTPFAGGTATGVIYLDANGLQRSDGPTYASSVLTVAGVVEVPDSANTVPNLRSSYNGTTGIGFEAQYSSVNFIFAGTRKAAMSSTALNFSSGGSGGFSTKLAFKTSVSSTLQAEVYANTDGILRLQSRTGDVSVYKAIGSEGSTLGTLNTGILTATAPTATDVPVSITGAAAQSVNLQEWNLSGGTLRATVTSAGEFSNPGSQMGSESFGAGAVATGNWATLIGNNTTGAAFSQATGYNTRAAANSVVIGHYGGQYGFNEQCVLLGQSASSNATNQFVAGSQYARIDNVYFSEGVTNATPVAYTINGTGGSGTDIAGADINIAGGIGTGTGVGGDVVFKTAAAGTTGTTPNTLAAALTINGGTGDATFGGDLTLSSPTVPASASATGTAGTISWDADYIYICTATDTWKRVAIATW